MWGIHFGTLQEQYRGIKRQFEDRLLQVAFKWKLLWL